MLKKGKLIVEGSIQGVGYRAFVKKVANNLGVRGVVKNLPDGRVEIIFEAQDEKTYEEFYKRINKKRKHEWDEFSINITSITPLEVKDVDKGGFQGLFEIDYGTGLDTFQKETLERQEMGILVLADFNFRTQESFQIMEQKYGAISKTLEELKTGLLAELAQGISILSGQREKKQA